MQNHNNRMSGDDLFFGFTKKFLISLALVCAFLWFFITKVGDVIIPPFIFSVITAYLCSNIVDKLTKRFELSRGLIAMSMVLVMFAGLIIFAVIFIPIALRNATLIKEYLPAIFSTLDGLFVKYLPSQIHQSLLAGYTQLEAFIPQIAIRIFGQLDNISSILTHVIGFFLVTPVTTFYMIKDWHKINDGILRLVPVAHRLNVIKIRTEIRQRLAGYLAGQLTIIMFLSVFYGISLWIAGLQFGFTIGVLTGIASIIPYAGIAIGVVVSVLVAFLSYKSMAMVGIILIIFAIGQIIEGGFLTPKLMSSRINIHPLWVIFGFLTFSVLFGFLGVLFALPLTAIASVLIKFYVENFYNKHCT